MNCLNTNTSIFFISILLFCITIFQSSADARYASIVIDERTGKVLHASNPDRQRYPASLTKMMTLYMVFDALDRGKIKLNQRLKVSRRAQGMAPSKLGLKRGQSITVLWRGKPVFIRRRTQEEISEARSVKMEDLIHPEKDEDRAKDPEWLVMLGVCTHLGCVPLNDKGDYDGWFCPCHGSHYDTSGRIRKGPAPLNMEVPKYEFVNANTIKIG